MSITKSITRGKSIAKLNPANDITIAEIITLLHEGQNNGDHVIDTIRKAYYIGVDRGTNIGLKLLERHIAQKA